MATGTGIGRKAVAPWTAWLLGLLVAIGGCTPPPDRDAASRRSPSSEPATDPNRAPSDAPRSAPVTPARDGAQATTPSAPADADRWDVDLRRDEERGGHTIARHVGRTDAQLKARLQRESISAASTYADLERAERVVALALAENERRVRRWIDQRSPKTNLAIRYRARDGLPTGRLLRRGADDTEDVTGAVVVLRWRADNWYVLTTYPENPR